MRLPLRAFSLLGTWFCGLPPKLVARTPPGVKCSPPLAVKLQQPHQPRQALLINRKSPFAKQRTRVDIATAEASETFRWIDRVADRHDVVIQTLGKLFVVI